jgi:hypothetical protein
VEWLFAEFFGCCPTAARQLADRASPLSSPAQTPLACTVNKIQDKGANCDNRKQARKQDQGRKHLLDKIHLQENKGH